MLTIRRESQDIREKFLTLFLNDPTNEELWNNYFSWENLIDVNSRPGKNELWIVRTIDTIEKRVDIRLEKSKSCSFSESAKALLDVADKEILYPPEDLPGKYAECGTSSLRDDLLSKNEVLIYHDAFTQDYFLNSMLRYLLGKSLRLNAAKGILKYQDFLLDADILPLIEGTADRFAKKPRAIIVLKAGTVRQLTTRDLLLPRIDSDEEGSSESGRDFWEEKIFQLLNFVNSTLKDLNRIGRFVHGSLLKENIYISLSEGSPTGRYSLFDFSTSSLQVSIRDSEGEVQEYTILPTLPSLESTGRTGDCPFIQIDYENHYYVFKNEDQYLLALKRGYIGRLAFSERQIFSTIDIYIFIISLLFDVNIRARFFADPRGPRYWRKLWITEAYALRVREDLENTTCKSCPVFISENENGGNTSSPDGYPTRLFEILAFLKNRPLKTIYLLPFDALIDWD